ncbi:DUF6152 family protein [Taklimakanibacter lacteus]|uniref:DUF6152 family protein n=1 Tax=Taklimakanibacter lacteus TaxID=2268456 RepID=UPI000E667922
MHRQLTAALLFTLSAATAASAHHGWGSYDSAGKFTIEAPIDMIAWQNPHAHVMLKYENATWEITLAPISRMSNRGLSEAMLKTGTMIKAEGYPSTRREHEMRAERITVDGKVYEMR